MNKRVLRKFAIPSSRPNPKNGIFCADQVKYVVRTAIKNIDHQRTLVLYIYAKESVLAGNHILFIHIKPSVFLVWRMGADKHGGERHPGQ